MPENLSLIMDIVVMALLAVTVFYAMRLSRQLNIMREGQGDLEQLVAELSSAVERADNAIRNMKQTASDSGDKLQKQINQARELFDELELITEVGNSLAERLQVLAERTRKSSGLSEPVGRKLSGKAGKSRVSDEADGGADDGSDKPRSRTERELLAAMQRAGRSEDDDKKTKKGNSDSKSGGRKS